MHFCVFLLQKTTCNQKLGPGWGEGGLIDPGGGRNMQGEELKI